MQVMKKILVIEDDEPVRNALVAALRRHGYEVLAAGHGAAGLELAFQERPNVILSDVNMPGQSGFDVLKQLRARTETAAIPVIIMTGEPQKADAHYSMIHGADDYLSKPFTMDQMLATVNARLERQEGIQRALETRNHAERINAAEIIRLQSTALEAAANGILITDAKGVILWVNHAFTLLTGFSADEAIGQTPRLLKSGRTPPKVYSQLWATISTGKVWHGDLINQRKNGELYDEETTITPVRGENGEIQNFVAIKQDVSERKQIELALTHKRDLLQALMDNLPDHIYFKDADSRFIRINSAQARHLGLLRPEDAIGKSDADFFSLREARQKLVDERRMLATGEPILGLVEKSETANETKWVSSTKVPTYGPDGQINGLVGISRDITASKRAEDELQRKTALLEAEFNSSIDGILVVDEQGKKVLQNRRLTELLKIPAAIAENNDDEAQLRWVVRQARHPEHFRDRVLYLNAHPYETSREEIEMQDGTILDRYSAPMLGKNGTYYGRLWIFHDITTRKRMEVSLRLSEEKFRGLVENFRDAIVTVDVVTGKFSSANPAAIKMFGAKDEEELLSLTPAAVSPERQPNGVLSAVRIAQLDAALANGVQHFEWVHRRLPGGEFFAEVLLTRMQHVGKPVSLATIRDITGRKRLESELFQARKLESIGQLAAGIAHEINTPTQYVGDNTRFVKDSFAAVAKVLESHEAFLAAAKAGAITPDLIARAEDTLAASDLEYLRGQIPQALQETLEGVERVSKIVRAMKEFSHPGGRDKTPADLNKAIESTATVARNVWKYVSDLKLDLDPALPFVPCFLGEFNQAILNLIINAAHAIGDVVISHSGTKGLITVQTRRDGDCVQVCVTDTGTGIPEAARPKIFEPFFTTKAVGKGTGQGLAMVYGTIVNRHGGTVSFETEVGHGTTFILRLPIKSKGDPAPPAPPVATPEQPTS
jgi:PAS domain S-box-containing protein